VDLTELTTTVGRLLRKRGLTLALAESCTGGLLGHLVTNIPGSSTFFLGGIVAYSYSLKERILSVRPSTLIQHGAVSRQTALEMARGCRHLTSAAIALAITGIAGPAGETCDKPVGLTFVALVAEDVEACERHVWQGNRLENKAASAGAALGLLEKYLRSGLLQIPDSDDEVEAEIDYP